MNYKKIYFKLIKKRIENEINVGYYEKHHIFPKSLGGSDNPKNLIKLTAREHFIAHFLLAKMYPEKSFEWYKMNHAFMIMKSSSKNNKRYINAKLYESLRKNFSNVMSNAQSGEKNSQYGTTFYIHKNANNINERKKFKKGENPIGFISTKEWREKNPKKKKKKCKICGEFVCKNKEICRRGQMINTFIHFLGFDEKKKGTTDVYLEFERIIKMLENDYHFKKMSIEEIKKKYNFTSNERVRMMLKSLKIHNKNYSKEKINLCCDCKKVISIKSKRCNSCSQKKKHLDGVFIKK